MLSMKLRNVSLHTSTSLDVQASQIFFLILVMDFRPREGYPENVEGITRNTAQRPYNSTGFRHGAADEDHGVKQTDLHPPIGRQHSRVGTKNAKEKRRRYQFRKVRFRIGLEPNKRIKQHHPGAEHLLWSRVRSVMQEPFSEFLGVFVFAMVQQGGLAQATLSVGETSAPGGNGFGSFLTVPFT